MTQFSAKHGYDYIRVFKKTLMMKLGKGQEQVPGPLTDARRQGLEESKKQGVTYLDQADHVRAIQSLSAVEAKYRAALSAPGADDALRRNYLDLLAQLATAYVIGGDKDKAADVFRLVIITFGSDAPVTDDEYRPDVVAVFSQVKSEVAKLEKGAIDVASTPLGAQIILNGDAKGKSPFQIKELVPGTYTLRLQRGASTSMLHRIRVDGGKVSKIHIDLPFESHLVRDEQGVGLQYSDLKAANKRIPLDAMTIGRLVGSNLVVVCGVFDGKLMTSLVDINENRVVRSSSVRVPQVGISRRAVERVVTTIVGGGTGDVYAGKKKWYQNIPAVVTGGVGILSLGISALYWGDMKTGDIPVATQKEADEVKSNQAVGGTLLTLGLLSGITSGVLFYLDVKKGKSTAASELRRQFASGVVALPPSGFGSENVSFVLG
jgi:hypothetical protein